MPNTDDDRRQPVNIREKLAELGYTIERSIPTADQIDEVCPGLAGQIASHGIRPIGEWIYKTFIDANLTTSQYASIRNKLRDMGYDTSRQSPWRSNLVSKYIPPERDLDGNLTVDIETRLKELGFTNDCQIPTQSHIDSIQPGLASRITYHGVGPISEFVYQGTPTRTQDMNVRNALMRMGYKASKQILDSGTTNATTNATTKPGERDKERDKLAMWRIDQFFDNVDFTLPQDDPKSFMTKCMRAFGKSTSYYPPRIWNISTMIAFRPNGGHSKEDLAFVRRYITDILECGNWLDPHDQFGL